MATARRLAREPMLASAMRWPRVRMAGPAWHRVCPVPSCPVRGGQAVTMAGPQRPGAPSPGRASAREVRGLEVIGGQSIHRVTAAAFAAARPGIWPGGVHRAPMASAGCAAMRAPWARPWVRTRPAGMRSSGSPGSWPPSAAEFRCVPLTLHSHPETSNSFPEFDSMFMAANRAVLTSHAPAGVRIGAPSARAGALSNNRTVSGDSRLKTAGLSLLAVRMWVGAGRGGIL
jgi:hypothetical protein